MEHFVSIILTNYELEEHLVESVLDSAGSSLTESETLYEMFETDNNEQVLRVELQRQLSEQEADTFAETLANKLFEMGYDDFELEVSTDEEQLPFDVVEDLFVFMKNDPMFYRRVYFPTISKVADLIKNNKKVSFTKAFAPVIDKAIEAYRNKFEMSKSVSKQFSPDSKESLINRIKEEELPSIRKGDY